MNTHETVSLVAGDDWQFVAQMLDPNDNPLDLSTGTVIWTLVDRFGLAALGPDDYSLQLSGTNIGQVIVNVPSTSTTKLGAGVYEDTWRATISGFTQTLLQGRFNVEADPFAASPEPVRSQLVELKTKRRAA